MPHAPADAALVKPAARVAGRLRVPGDKSISHRYAMLAALADGRSNIHGYLRARTASRPSTACGRSG